MENWIFDIPEKTKLCSELHYLSRGSKLTSIMDSGINGILGIEQHLVYLKILNWMFYHQA